MTVLAADMRRPHELGADPWHVALAVLLAVAAVASAGPRPLVIGLVWLAVVTPRLVAVDQAEHRLPDAIVLPAVPIALAAVALDGPLQPAVLAAIGYAGVLLVLHEAGGMGLGDVKLALPLGLLAGADGRGLASALLALAIGGAWSAVVLVRHGRGTRIPFGPAMLLGCWAAVLLR